MAPKDSPANNSEGHSRSSRTHRNRRSAVTDSAMLEDQCHPRKIFVGGLAHRTTTQGLREHFQKYGSIVDAVVLRWPDGRSRGFGYVTFNEVVSATTALQESHSIGGRPVDVKRAVPGTNKVFVGGLPQSATAAELRRHFEACGTVSDAVVMIDPVTNRSRGFGFVCFLPGQEGAAAVAAALADYANHRIRGKWIEVKSAAPPHKLQWAKEDHEPEHELEQDQESWEGSTSCEEKNSPLSQASLAEHEVKEEKPSPIVKERALAPPGLPTLLTWCPMPSEPCKVDTSRFEFPRCAKPTGGFMGGQAPVKVQEGLWADSQLQEMPGFVDASRELQQQLTSLFEVHTTTTTPQSSP